MDLHLLGEPCNQHLFSLSNILSLCSHYDNQHIQYTEPRACRKMILKLREARDERRGKAERIKRTRRYLYVNIESWSEILKTLDRRDHVNKNKHLFTLKIWVKLEMSDSSTALISLVQINVTSMHETGFVSEHFPSLAQRNVSRQRTKRLPALLWKTPAAYFHMISYLCPPRSSVPSL